MKNEAIQLDSAMKELKKNLKVKVKGADEGDLNIDVDFDDARDE
ncbi:MAG: hypothetical protein QM817_27670 [Archangium sp.]